MTNATETKNVQENNQIAVESAAPKTTKKAKEPKSMVERYKTKMCASYMAGSPCNYEFKCMFAHGDEDKRTKAMNVKDGLVNEEAVRAWQWKIKSASDAQTHHSPNVGGFEKRYPQFSPTKIMALTAGLHVQSPYRHTSDSTQQGIRVRVNDPYAYNVLPPTPEYYYDQQYQQGYSPSTVSERSATPPPAYHSSPYQSHCDCADCMAIQAPAPCTCSECVAPVVQCAPTGCECAECMPAQAPAPACYSNGAYYCGCDECTNADAALLASGGSSPQRNRVAEKNTYANAYASSNSIDEYMMEGASSSSGSMTPEERVTPSLEFPGSVTA